MPRKQTSGIDANQGSIPIGADTQTLQILLKEYDALREMYNQASHNGQTMFNYYLTLMTAVFGGVALISQPSSGIFMQKTTSGLLLIFFAIIGSFYLSSLSTNFAHATRYANGINELRKFIIARYGVPMPWIYTKFLAEKHKEEQSRAIYYISFFIPVNTYQLVTATVNSMSWAFAVSIVYYGSDANMTFTEIAARGILTFIITYLIYNIYARFIYQFTISNSNITIGH
jgi:hypothetical protein